MSPTELYVAIVEVVAYVLGGAFCFVVLDRISRAARPLFPVSYTRRNLQLALMSLIWPLLVTLIPIGMVSLIIWLFFKASRAGRAPTPPV